MAAYLERFTNFRAVLPVNNSLGSLHTACFLLALRLTIMSLDDR